MNRRDFVKTAGAAASIAAVNPTFAMVDNSKIKLGIIGVGLRGQNHLDLALRRSDAEVVAICDIDDRMLTRANEIIMKSGKASPKVFKGDAYAWRKLVELQDLDAVLICTPWEWHATMIVESLEAGIKYVGTEVVLGITLQDHWNVVQTAERTHGSSAAHALANAAAFKEVGKSK